MESRSSLVMPGNSSQRQDSKFNSPDRHNKSGEDLAGYESSPSLPYNTDINVEKITVKHSKDDTGSPKAMRKAATNANMLQLSFK